MGPRKWTITFTGCPRSHDAGGFELSRRLDSRDGLHPRSLAWAKVASPLLIVTDYILLETVNYLSRPQDRTKVCLLANRILTSSDYEVVPASPQLLRAGLKLHEQSSYKAWSLTDYISFIVMRERGISQALTHDHHFEQAGFEALLRRDPP